MTIKRVEPIYLYRRKGHPDWATCDFQRYAELSDHTLFETRLACDMDELDVLLSLNAELMEAFEAATKGVISMVIELELGKPATSAQIEKTIQLSKPGSLVGDMVAALAKARSQS